MLALLGIQLTLAFFSNCAIDPPFPKPPLPIRSEEIDQGYWEKKARERFAATIKQFPEFYNYGKAKNAILFLGDGMGVPTISATRFYKSEVDKSSGENSKFPFENWEFNTMCRTYDLETMVTDSASSATAYLTGTKTRTGMLGLTGAVNVKDCRVYTDKERIKSVLDAAAEAGKSTGIVTSARVTHASPAGAYGKMSFRDWESDKKITDDIGGGDDCKDLALQLIEEHYDINVVLGGGQEMFYPSDVPLPADKSKMGKRNGKAVLPNVWVEKQKEMGRKYKLVENMEQFRGMTNFDVDYLLGILEPSHLDYVLDRPSEKASLTDLTEAALKILQRNPNGFYLFVEGARIDHAHHDNTAKKALTEMIEFSETIAKVQSMVNLSETLLLVTADHSHSFELVGQPSRFESLLTKDKGYGPQVQDSKSMIPAGYASGPGAETNAERKDVNAISVGELTGKDFRQQALVPLGGATHAGEDVPVYATGPFSWMFHRTVDNTFIAQSMKFAMCIDPYTEEKHCSDKNFITSCCAKLLANVAWIIIFINSFTNY